MITIKSDDVYGRAKAYESIIKNEPIVGPKLPESFNVLVKELQGLGLRVDLLDESEDVVDAEQVIREAQDEIEAQDVEEIDDEIIAHEVEEIDDELADQGVNEIEEIKEDA